MAEKRGLPKGKTNNPNGRPKGSKNKFSYDVKKYIYNTIANDGYVNELLNDIDAVVEEKKQGYQVSYLGEVVRSD